MIIKNKTEQSFASVEFDHQATLRPFNPNKSHFIPTEHEVVNVFWIIIVKMKSYLNYVSEIKRYAHQETLVGRHNQASSSFQMDARHVSCWFSPNFNQETNPWSNYVKIQALQKKWPELEAVGFFLFSFFLAMQPARKKMEKLSPSWTSRNVSIKSPFNSWSGLTWLV